MKQMKLISFLAVIPCLIFTNFSSVRTDYYCPYTVEPQPMPSGSVQTLAITNQITYVPDYPLLFIGDSRTVGMKQTLLYYGYDLTNHSFIAEIGKGYSWLSYQRSITSISPSIIILNLGVNDLGNLSNYQTLYEKYAKTCWSECPIYIVSVNPCCAPCTSVSNQRISAFNTSMQQWIEEYNKEYVSANTGTFPIRYIDTYNYLLSEGFSSSDGLHYSNHTYEQIYAYILDQIQESIGDGTGSYTFTASY